jgi:UDP-N-acetylglucosamine 2-epimerase
LQIISIVGARPQFVKIAMVAEAVRAANLLRPPEAQVKHRVVHTGQHYDQGMSDVFFRELPIPTPEHNLEVGSGSHGKQTAALLERTEKVLLENRPDVVAVYGDTNSTIAAGLAAVKLGIPVAHVEAGLRSFNRQMPEEINRVATDHISDLLFCPTETAVENLRNEGITKNVFLSGDVMLDAVLSFRRVARERSQILSKLALSAKKYALLTIHRAENTNSTERIQEVLDFLLGIKHPVVFPMHPRTKDRLEKEPALSQYKKRLELSGTIRVIDPVSYVDMLALEDGARVILTDSGGVQKEAYFLEVPCLTVRGETEWVETLAGGWNQLIEPSLSSLSKIEGAWNANGSGPQGKPNLEYFGNGQAAERIVAELLQIGS